MNLRGEIPCQSHSEKYEKFDFLQKHLSFVGERRGNASLK